MTEFLFMGPTNSGKSLLLARLKKLAKDHKLTPFDPMPQTQPTQETEDTNFLFRGLNFTFKELGGESIDRYTDFIETSKAIIYIFDSADFTTTATNVVYLDKILKDENLESKPILVVLSKCDIPDRIKFSIIDTIIPLSKYKNPDRISYLETSSVIGIGLNEIFHWIADQMK